MKKLSDKLRYKYMSLTKGLKFAEKITNRLYKRYLGHDKIIAWHKGYPMFSTFSPMSASDVFANKISTFILQGLQHMPKPHLVDIAVTDKCNSNCEHCSFYNVDKKNDFESKHKEIMSLDEVKSLINDALDLGVTSLKEPLINFMLVIFSQLENPRNILK